MSRDALHRGIQRELAEAFERGILDEDERSRVAALYPATSWNILSLARWFTILGAVAIGAGVLLLLRHLGSAIRLAEVGCLVFFSGALVAARALEKRGLKRTSATVELLAGFALQGLAVALAMDFSTGESDWPALVGACTGLLLALAYTLGNRLVLIHALVNAFVWFGATVGYRSYGAYWLKMLHPVRFMAIGAVTVVVAWVHAIGAVGLRRQAFSRVYLHFGLLVINLSFWFLSVFGIYEEHGGGTDAERVLSAIAWTAASLGSIVAAGKLGQRVLRSYGLVFFIINLYTFYFQYFVFKSAEAWFIHLLLTGGSLIAVGFWLEKQLRGPVRSSQEPAQAPAPPPLPGSP